MITDEQGMEWLFKKLYDDGWRYYVKNIGGVAYLTTKKPVMNGNILDITSGGTSKYANAICNVMPEINKCEVLDIAEELGIVDWSKVKVDTPIYVRAHESNTWEKRHFAFFKDGKVYAWLNGATSWTIENTSYVFSWECAKLAEV